MFPQGAVVRYVCSTKEPVLAVVQGGAAEVVHDRTDEWMLCIENSAYLYCVHCMTGHEFCRVCASKWFVGSVVHPPGGGGGASFGDRPPRGGGGPSSLGGAGHGGARVKEHILLLLAVECVLSVADVLFRFVLAKLSMSSLVLHLPPVPPCLPASGTPAGKLLGVHLLRP